MLNEKIFLYIRLTRINQPVGFFLVLWPALLGLCFASPGLPKLKFVIIFTLGSFVMRSLGCMINDYFDREFDRHVARTHLRPLAQKKLPLKEVFAVGLILSLISLILVYHLNFLCIKLAAISFILTLIYPLMKRWIKAPQLVLGLAFAMGGLMAFASIQNKIPLEAIVFFIAIVLMVLAYDTQYALSDIKDDKKLKLNSSAIWFGH